MERNQMKFYSNAKQDEFVANILNFKKNGYCVDIGSHHSIVANNTYFFQSLGWSSISVEWDSSLNDTYNTRKLGTHYNENALEIDYKRIFEENDFPMNIDYLSLDVDDATLGVLKSLPFNEYKFKVITIEHDGYLHGDIYRKEQRNILNSLGYFLLCSNVYVEQDGFYGKQCPFEDWWIDANEFDQTLINKIKCKNTLPSTIVDKFKV